MLAHQVPCFANDEPRAELLLAAPIRAICSGEVIAAKDGQRTFTPLPEPGRGSDTHDVHQCDGARALGLEPVTIRW